MNTQIKKNKKYSQMILLTSTVFSIISFNLVVNADDLITQEPVPVVSALPSSLPTITEITPTSYSKTASSTLPPAPKVNFDYSLKFDPTINKVPAPEIKFKYSVQEAGILISNSEISEDTVKVYLGKPDSWHPSFKKNNDFEDGTYFLISFPSSLYRDGKLDFVAESGVPFLSLETSGDLVKLGSSALKTLQTNKVFEPKEPLTFLAGVINLQEYPLLNGKKKGTFKICLNSKIEKFKSQICTPPHRYLTQGKKIKAQIEVTPAKVIINDKKVETTDTFAVAENQEFQFYGINEKQFTYEFKTKVQPLFVIDYYEETKTQNIILSGHTSVPTGFNVTLLNPENKDSWLYKIGWLPTIGDFKVYWSARLLKESTTLDIPGFQGGLFLYQLKFDSAPQETLKFSLNSNTLPGTYSDSPILSGKLPANLKANITSKEKSVTVNKKSNQFSWIFDANKKGDYITKTISINDGESNREWLSQKTIYRGFANELSFRLGGAVSSQLQANILAEFNYNRWYEKLFGWDNGLFSNQRWGTSLRHFAPLKTISLKETTGTTAVSLTQTTLDLKYRLTPGLWERDETWGFILGLQNVKLNQLTSPFIGGGFFWARSMPKVFDRIANWFPFMSYSKWVDMDFMYYSVPLKSGIEPDLNASINFHGKILWAKNIFGEAGFGYKAYGFTDRKLRQKTSFGAFYGTAGLGINF